MRYQRQFNDRARQNGKCLADMWNSMEVLTIAQVLFVLRTQGVTPMKRSVIYSITRFPTMLQIF